MGGRPTIRTIMDLWSRPRYYLLGGGEKDAIHGQRSCTEERKIIEHTKLQAFQSSEFYINDLQPHYCGKRARFPPTIAWCLFPKTRGVESAMRWTTHFYRSDCYHLLCKLPCLEL